MKNSIPLYCCSIFLTIASMAQENKLPATLLDRKEYFMLERELPQISNENDKSYFQCFVDNAFNRNDQCIRNADKFLNRNPSTIGPAQKAALLLLKADSYFKKGDYEKAANPDSAVLADYPAVLEHSLHGDTETQWQIRNALRLPRLNKQ